jgi:flavin reductase (DIM6/NTAB) family NADH-FMN oxidoreductase RutF
VSSAMDRRELCRCLSRFATGVSIVTCKVDGHVHGATVNAFTAVSLDPPLILISLDRRSKLSTLIEGRPFVVNVLGEAGHRYASHFAGDSQQDLSIQWAPDSTAPRLADTLAYLVCAPWRTYDGGDHLLYLGEVRCFAFESGRPLVYYASSFCSLGETAERAPWLQSSDSPFCEGPLSGYYTLHRHLALTGDRPSRSMSP